MSGARRGGDKAGCAASEAKRPATAEMEKEYEMIMTLLRLD